MSPDIVSARFEWAWPYLQKSIQAAKATAGAQPTAPPVTEMDLLQKLVASVDAIQRGDFQQPTRTTLIRLGLSEGDEYEPDYEDFRKALHRKASKYRPVVSMNGGGSHLELKLALPKLNEEERDRLSDELMPLVASSFILGPVD